MEYCNTKHLSLLDDTICSMLRECSRIAVVGLSDKPWRPSYRIAVYLKAHGYEIIPVNPEITEVLGIASYPSLPAAPQPIELVNIFRRAEHIPLLVEDSIRIGAKAVWMQSGLADPVAARYARSAGLRVVMDRCIMVEHMAHFG